VKADSGSTEEVRKFSDDSFDDQRSPEQLFLCLKSGSHILEMRKKSGAPTILPCGKDSDDLFISVNIVVSLVFNPSFKTFNPIEKDRLNVLNVESSQISVTTINRLK
jgi:hypothetical protein